MTTKLQNNEPICDLKGCPLSPRPSTLLKALNKMLTVGSYYADDHEQYVQASIQSCQEIIDIVGAPSQSFIIEITAQGLMVGGQVIEPEHRQVRLLYDLLVPLNIARLEIKGTLTPQDLRHSIVTFQEHRSALGQSKSFHEIRFDNLPPSVQATSCSVLQQSDDSLESGVGNLAELLGSWDEQDFTKITTEDMSVSEKLAGQFMNMVTRILENIEKVEGANGQYSLNSHDGSYVTKEDLVSLRQALQRLVDVNPDPIELTKLITHAQRALHLSQDAKSVNLAFSILKKDLAPKNNQKKSPKNKKSSRTDFTFTVDELLSIVNELEKKPAPVEEPREISRSNQLVISLQLLQSDPPKALRNGMLDSIKNIMIRPDFSEHNLCICAQFFNSHARENGIEEVDKILTMVMDLFRENQISMIAPFWAHLTELAGEEYLPQLWPYLVNDILLGFEGAPRKTVKKLVLTAGMVPLNEAKNVESQLLKQPALQKHTGSRDLFVAPLKSLYTVHAILRVTSLSGWLCNELHRSLCSDPTSKLTEVVMSVLPEPNPEQLDFYLDLIKHNDNQTPPPELREPVVKILQDVLTNPSSGRLNESWVPQGLIELNKLDPDGSKPLLNKVINDRKFLFFKVWPGPARKAAAQILANASPGGV